MGIFPLGVLLAAVGCGVFGAGSGFVLGWCMAGGGLVRHFSGAFLLVFGSFLFWRGGGLGAGYHSVGFLHFPDISEFPGILRLKWFGNS